jgi:hypothetical protein
MACTVRAATPASIAAAADEVTVLAGGTAQPAPSPASAAPPPAVTGH